MKNIVSKTKKMFNEMINIVSHFCKDSRILVSVSAVNLLRSAIRLKHIKLWRKSRLNQ